MSNNKESIAYVWLAGESGLEIIDAMKRDGAVEEDVIHALSTILIKSSEVLRVVRPDAEFYSLTLSDVGGSTSVNVAAPIVNMQALCDFTGRMRATGAYVIASSRVKALIASWAQAPAQQVVH